MKQPVKPPVEPAAEPEVEFGSIMEFEQVLLQKFGEIAPEAKREAPLSRF